MQVPNMNKQLSKSCNYSTYKKPEILVVGNLVRYDIWDSFADIHPLVHPLQNQLDQGGNY